MYHYNFTETILDSDLIGGFLTAIRNFGTELSAAEAKDKAMQRLSYQHFEIELLDGKYSIAALILSGQPNSLILERQKEYLIKFERKFEIGLKDFSGDVSQFGRAEEIVKEIFLKE